MIWGAGSPIQDEIYTFEREESVPAMVRLRRRVSKISHSSPMLHVDQSGLRAPSFLTLDHRKAATIVLIW
jgi:hypothetical protein